MFLMNKNLSVWRLYGIMKFSISHISRSVWDNYALGADKTDNGPNVYKWCKIQLKG